MNRPPFLRSRGRFARSRVGGGHRPRSERGAARDAPPPFTRIDDGTGEPFRREGFFLARGGPRRYGRLAPTRAQPAPYPPPAGVSITTRSPGSSSTRSLPCMGSIRPSARSTHSRPTSPGAPPFTPKGGVRREEPRVVQVI